MRGGEEGMREGVLLVLVVGGGWGGKWMGRRDVHLHAEWMVCGEVEGDGVWRSGGGWCGGKLRGMVWGEVEGDGVGGKWRGSSAISISISGGHQGPSGGAIRGNQGGNQGQSGGGAITHLAP